MKKSFEALILSIAFSALIITNARTVFAADSDDGLFGLFNFNHIWEAIRHSILDLPRQFIHRIFGNWLVYLGWGLLIIVPLIGIAVLINYLVKKPKTVLVPINQINQPSPLQISQQPYYGPILYVTQANGYKQEVPMMYDRMIIGRNPNSQILLEDEKISDQHAEIYIQEGRYFVRDLGSTYGTFVNGAPIYGVVELFSGYYVQMGDSTIQL